MENDPEEINDLAGKPEFADKVKELLRELRQMQKDLNDSLDLTHINS
jgi:hypothetical protein